MKRIATLHTFLPSGETESTPVCADPTGSLVLGDAVYSLADAGIDTQSFASLVFAAVAKGETQGEAMGVRWTYAKGEWNATPATPDQVAAHLCAMGIPATVEHPAHVRVAMPYGVSLAVGTLNGPWEVDVIAPDGDTASGGHDAAHPLSPADTVARMVARAVRSLSARFVWTVGAYTETHPDIPADLPLCLWDRQERTHAVTVSDAYAPLIALEHGKQAPFTALETWANSLRNDTLASEGLPMTLPALDAQLASRAEGATVDVTPILTARTVDEVTRAGGALILSAQGNANLAAVQLAMRTRAVQLDNR